MADLKRELKEIDKAIFEAKLIASGEDPWAYSESSRRVDALVNYRSKTIRRFKKRARAYHVRRIMKLRRAG